MELKPTNRDTFCLPENYYPLGIHEHFASWEDFKAEWCYKDSKIDHRSYHCFRFDIYNDQNEHGDELDDTFVMYLLFMWQRKGAYIPVEIKGIKQKDKDDIESFLRDCYEYNKRVWSEFSSEESLDIDAKVREKMKESRKERDKGAMIIYDLARKLQYTNPVISSALYEALTYIVEDEIQEINELRQERLQAENKRISEAERAKGIYMIKGVADDLFDTDEEELAEILYAGIQWVEKAVVA